MLALLKKKGIQQRHLHDPCIHTHIREETLQIFSSSHQLQPMRIHAFSNVTFGQPLKKSLPNDVPVREKVHRLNLASLTTRSQEPMEGGTLPG